MNMYLNQALVAIDGKQYLEDHSAEVFCQKLLF